MNSSTKLVCYIVCCFFIISKLSMAAVNCYELELETPIHQRIIFQEGSDIALFGDKQIHFTQDAQILCDDNAILDFECLLASYPEIITGIIADEQKKLWLIVNGHKVLYDDGEKRSYTEALLNGTVKDSMAQLYPLEPSRPIPDIGIAPGRVRSYALLEAIYGNSKEEVEKQLIGVKFNKRKKICFFSHSAKAAQNLKDVFTQLNILLDKNPQVYEYIFPLSDGFTWRVIAGEKRLSPHSYGIAIDLHPKKGIYWRIVKDREKYLQIQKDYPSELVRLFEQKGFIWGGKWYEYDFMHFEYRPELIYKAQRSIHNNTI